ncbi:glycoprotein D [Phocid alphaherpesvirus 1]|uniref:Glycoprotein D n=2 Tax=Phocid alphaherpesvirus 1 TaxID=47418 RepID=A0A482F621_9ALPH|nr:glycoprotein D [Phocid alphaherpesvirus 1]QBN85188.1 glycoprotein D [Phocid alphaherpesvirus 1]UNP64299.1 glycoprotein D [Phocid alphaherpesvirus 1]
MIGLIIFIFFYNGNIAIAYNWIVQPLRYNYTVLDLRPNIPNPMDSSKNAEVRYVTSTDPCGMVALISEPNIESTIKTIQFVNKKKYYNASLSWFKVGDDCTYPIYLIKYFNCDPQKEFGICLKRTPDYWKPSLIGYSFLTDNELGLVFAAPAPFNQGQYRRVIIIEKEVFYTDFMVKLPKETCPFAMKDRVERDLPKWCKEAKEFGPLGTDEESFYLNRAVPQPRLKYYVIREFYRMNGREPPVKFKEALRYDKPYRFEKKTKESQPKPTEIKSKVSSEEESKKLEEYLKISDVNLIDGNIETQLPINNSKTNITIAVVTIIIIIILSITGFFIYRRRKYNNYKRLPVNI